MNKEFEERRAREHAALLDQEAALAAQREQLDMERALFEQEKDRAAASEQSNAQLHVSQELDSTLLHSDHRRLDDYASQLAAAEQRLRAKEQRLASLEHTLKLQKDSLSPATERTLARRARELEAEAQQLRQMQREVQQFYNASRTPRGEQY